MQLCSGPFIEFNLGEVDPASSSVGSGQPEAPVGPIQALVQKDEIAFDWGSGEPSMKPRSSPVVVSEELSSIRTTSAFLAAPC